MRKFSCSGLLWAVKLIFWRHRILLQYYLVNRITRWSIFSSCTY